MKQAIVDRSPSIASAALVSAMNMSNKALQVSGNIVSDRFLRSRDTSVSPTLADDVTSASPLLSSPLLSGSGRRRGDQALGQRGAGGSQLRLRDGPVPRAGTALPHQEVRPVSGNQELI